MSSPASPSADWGQFPCADSRRKFPEQLVELDQDAGERSGVIRADLESRRERIGAYDVLIAGIALARGHVLATHNVREFGRVAGLQIEDWAAIP